MKERALWTVLGLVFLTVNLYAFAAGDLAGLLGYLGGLGPWGLLATVDLVLALVVGLYFVWRDARARSVSPWPWVALTCTTGSLGLLFYLARHRGAAAPPVVRTADGRFVVSLTRVVPFPAARVWEVLADFHGVDKFHPFVSHVDGGAVACGVGAERVCHLRGLPSLKERVTEWEEGSGYRIDASSALDVLGGLSGGLWLSPLNERGTEVRFELGFRPRLGLIGRVVGPTWLRFVASGMGPHVLAGLEHHLHTGGKLATNGRSLGDRHPAAASTAPA